MKKLLILSAIIFFIFISYFLYINFAYTNIVVKFDELEPFEKPMKVYFKGFRVGKTTKIYPNRDYTSTYLKLQLKSQGEKFPSNIKVNIKKKKSGGYVDIVYPDDPTIARLKNNDVVQGFITKDINSLLESENIEDIVDDAGSLIESANSAVKSLDSIFIEIRGVIADNRPYINSTVKNLASTSENLNSISMQLKNSFSRNNIDSSLENIEQTTKNIQDITKQIDDTTIPIVNNTLCEAYSTVKNTKDITSGVKNTLSKRMGLGRLFFGRPIAKDCDSY